MNSIMTIKDLNPAAVWHYFHELTQIPRPSKKEGKIIAYLLDFANKHNLESKKDEAGNVLITKRATKGKENCPTVILQGHVDMVCEKNNDTEHDFDNDPIETYVDGDWLKARGTTLGADNGIGVAAALAILSDDNIVHPRLECLFTVDEETGLTGAFALSNDFLTGDILLNLDTEEVGEIYIGCAGGKVATITFSYKPETVPQNYFWFKAQIKGLNGGHSGSEIHVGLGNANKLLNRYLWTLNKKYNLALSEFNGGNLHNAIPREAYAVAGIPFDKKEDVAVIANVLLAEFERELKNVDTNVKLLWESCPAPQNIIDDETKNNLLNAIYAAPHGVAGMSQDIEGLVETSNNFASVKMADNNTIIIRTSIRSSTESLKYDLANKIDALFTLAKAKVEFSGGYPGWKPNPNSTILKVAQEAHKIISGGQEAKVKAIHAGLECGLFLEKYPHLDMISFGPTITDAHSPAEQVNIPSVSEWWNLLLETLKNIPAK